MTQDGNRRQFLCQAAGRVAAPLIVSASSLGNRARAAASERITVGVIGLGSRGFNLLVDLGGQRDAQIVALCDVDERHYRDRAWGQGRAYGRQPALALTAKAAGKPPAMYADYRELCARQDIDAVVVATPDHWHALCSREALRSGKDVYCEKPVTHFFREGQVIYREVAKQKAVFQTGSQQRSDRLFRQAVELVLNGHLGRIKRIEVGLPPGYNQPQGDATVVAPPKHLDYDLGVGPAELLPYMRARHHRWWRGHRAFGGGVLMDWIGHHFDIAHWSLGLDDSGPQRVEAVDWQFPQTPVYNTPHHYAIRCEYRDEVTAIISSRLRLGTKWIGDAGWLFVTRGRIAASDAAILRPDFDRGPQRVYASPGHMRNFLDCVKSRRPCIAPAETAHRSITPGHLAYVSHELQRALQWDAQRERVVDDPAANERLSRMPYRQPWSLA